MASLTELSAGQIFLLAVHYASESNVDALRTLAAERSSDLDSELFLRILLSYLPESVDPILYTTFAGELARGVYSDRAWADGEHFTPVDTAPVKDLSVGKAAKRAKRVAANLLHLPHFSCPSSLCPDILTQFLIHRANRIDTQIGILNLIPSLVDPFLESSEYLRTWYISSVLPLLRLGYEYYPNDQTPISLDRVELADGERGVEYLLSMVMSKTPDGDATHSTLNKEEEHAGTALARDMKGLVGPWMYGYEQRKLCRPKQTQRRRGTLSQDLELETDRHAQASEDSQKDTSEGSDTGHDWEYAFKWMTKTAAHKFPMVAESIDDWDGPKDVDLGGYHEGPYLPEDIREKLHTRYVQSALAAVYTAETATREIVSRAHGVLVRIAALMDYVPPPDLATYVTAFKPTGHESVS
jgi:hypothetical protein